MLRESIEKFVEHYLKPLVTEADKPKFVHDPLWGTIEVTPYELDILDSPLLQRLRQIHQTGFVHATFPSARHSRFEHTLGVMHIAGKMAKTLRARYPAIVDETTRKARAFGGAFARFGTFGLLSYIRRRVQPMC